MRIAHLSIRSFRGINSLDWCPSPKLNCLIGPGDSCKTTILDAIEIAMNPRFGYTGSDPDIYACNPESQPEIKVTLVALPEPFLSERKFGLFLRGWSERERKINDEPQEGDLEALTVRAVLDPETLEWSWEIFNDRIETDAPPRFGFRDARQIAPNRLGTFAVRDLTWSRNSALSRLESESDSSGLLAQAVRSARASFRSGDRTSFDEAVELTSKVGKHFLVPSVSGYEAQLDIQSGVLASGAVSLHDGQLPLRSLGSGSSKLMVAGLQHSNRAAPILLSDEIELGLEPHRIMRLLRFLRSGFPTESSSEDKAAASANQSQIILTTHSPVVICELSVAELYCVRNSDGNVAVSSVQAATPNEDIAQRHVRGNPSAFLAPRIIIGEGRTECGFQRGLDEKWYEDGQQSFAYKGVVVVDGGGKDKAPILAKHLLSLGYGCLVLLDTDQPVSEDDKKEIRKLGGIVKEWPEKCDVERRIFLDVPWNTAKQLIDYAIQEVTEDRVVDNLQKTAEPNVLRFDRAALDALDDTENNRKWLAKAATLKTGKSDKSWFKNMERGEQLGSIIHPCLNEIAAKPLGVIIQEIRNWVDG